MSSKTAVGRWWLGNRHASPLNLSRIECGQLTRKKCYLQWILGLSAATKGTLSVPSVPLSSFNTESTEDLSDLGVEARLSTEYTEGAVRGGEIFAAQGEPDCQWCRSGQAHSGCFTFLAPCQPKSKRAGETNPISHQLEAVGPGRRKGGALAPPQSGRASSLWEQSVGLVTAGLKPRPSPSW
jgi:hypothetical protein